MPATGNPSSALMANHPPSIKALSPALTVAPPLQLSNSLSTTPSRRHTWIFSDPMQATTPSVQSIHTTSRHHHRSRNSNASIASCATSMIPALTDPLHSHLPPILREHPSHDLSSLVREVFGSGLARALHRGETRQTTSCFDAPPSLHPVAGSSEPVPLTLTSSAPLMVQSNWATFNVPPTASFALCPHVRTLLEW